MFVTPNLNQPEKHEFISLLSAIDRKIYCLGKLAWERASLGAEHRGIEYDFESILDYREIILSKMAGCGHHKNVSLSQITSRIKKLTNG